MKQKGFTLFTALIAFLLISLSLLLITSMVSTERNSYEIISNIAEQQEMQAIADLSRADALQVFNFGIRYAIEDFSKKDKNPGDGFPDNKYYMFDDISDWDLLQEKFVEDRFGVSPTSTTSGSFALIAARHLISLLLRVEDARGFRIELVNPNETVMAGLLKDTFANSASNNDFFEVIDCPNGTYNTCVGTFYVTLDLSENSIPHSDYELFPQVSVTNTLTGRTLKEPIMPRGKFRIYVPIRLFKALAGAREMAFANGNGILDNRTWSSIEGHTDRVAMKSALENIVDTRIGNLRLSSDDDGFRLRDYQITVITDIDDSLSSYEVNLYFEDTNPKYRVRKVGDNVYGITLKRFA